MPGVVDVTAAQRYAEAFVDTCAPQELAGGLEELEASAQIYADSKPLQNFLGSPEIGTEEKTKLLDRLWADSAGRQTQELLQLLLKKNRIDHLPVIAQEAVRISETRQGVLHGQLTTAHPISDAETQSVAQALGKLLGREIVLERSVERELLGGIQVRVGTTLLDGSIQKRLEDLRETLKSVKVT